MSSYYGDKHWSIMLTNCCCIVDDCIKYGKSNSTTILVIVITMSHKYCPFVKIGEYLNLTGMKWQEGGENYIMRRSMIHIIYKI
jgi:hypothetical protein